MNLTCPSCQMENAYLKIVDAKGSHYTCPDCDYEWCDPSVRADEDDEENEKPNNLKQFNECPNCSEDGNRWVYKCNDCEFIGCYDEVYEYGCYQGDEEIEQCPDCGGLERTKIGKVGVGTSEE